MTTQIPPRWDLSNVYPALDSKEYNADFEKLHKLITGMEDLLGAKAAGLTGKEEVSQLSVLAKEVIERYNEILLVAGTLLS